jgi:hypothetical protein
MCRSFFDRFVNSRPIRAAASWRAAAGSNALSVARTLPAAWASPLDFKKALGDAGWAKGELRRLAHLTEAADVFGLERINEALMTAKDRTERRVLRQLARLARLVEREAE